MKKLLVGLLWLLTCVSGLAQAYGELPAGYIGTVNQTATNTYQLFSYSWTATTTGANYFGIALRQDPGYWSVGSFKLTAQGSGINLLSNPNLQYGGTTNTQYGLQAPANWGLWYQSGNGAPPAAGMYYAPGQGWMGSTTLGGGVNTSTSGSWIDGAVGTYDGIYQGFSATAGTIYNFSFYSAGTNPYSNPSIMIGVYAGACASGSNIFTCTPSNTALTAAATPQETQGTGGAPPPEPPAPPPPAPTAIYNFNTQPVYITRAIPTTSNSPSNEGPNNAFDNNPNTKYLNFDKKNAGVTVQLNSGRVVSGFTVTTANDFSGRDPTSYKLYGSNDGSTWTLIKQDNITLSDSRYTTSSLVDVANTTAYAYYFMLFPTTKAGDGCGQNCNSMQIAEITYYYDANSTVTSTATSSTIVDPVTASANTLCCGGSAAVFNADSAKSAQVINFSNRTTADSKVLIEQIGNQNTVTVNQSGTRNNYAAYHGNGSNNNISISQSGTQSTIANYADLTVTGNNNSVNLQQTSTAGAKAIFATVSDNNNSLLIQQRDGGNHWADVSLAGGNKNVDILQSGSASHMAKISLSGLPVDLSLTQAGSTQQFYSIQFNCATAGGCPKITVQQGQ